MKQQFVVSVFVLAACLSCNNKSGINIEKEKEAMKQADIDFSNLSKSKGMKAAFLQYMDTAAVLLRPGHSPLKGMAAGQLIEKARKKPAQYRVNVEKWSDLLEIKHDLPRWRFWPKVYSLAATLIIGEENGEWDGQSQYMLSSNLRDLVEGHAEAFVLNQIGFPDPRQYPGEQYSSAFADSIANLAAWITTVV